MGGVSMERIAHSGGLILSAIVTDGKDVWRHAVTFYDFTPEQAAEVFAEDLSRLGLTIEEE